MRGILADVNIELHVRQLHGLLLADARRDLWLALNLDALMFADLALDPNTVDRLVWQRCQAEGLVLVTANRNQQGSDSLEETIRTLNQADSLPVLTIADDQRFLTDPGYREQVADRCLECLHDINNLLGTGRLFVP
jgi:hypothetical protein